ncbi:MAG: peroxide stress protein YaaA [Sarcina sp.]
MIAILSPAKTFDLNKTNFKIKTSTPDLLNDSEIIMKELKTLEVHDLVSLMKINEKIAVVNFIRNQEWKKFNGENEKACILSFKGEAYRGLNAGEFSIEELEFCNKHLRILSGLYGILKPLDGIKCYRLEMGTKINIKDNKNLYDFWKKKLSRIIIDEINKNNEEKVLINLASEEYFKVLDIKHNIRVVTPVFKEKKGINYKVVTIYTKKARGMMVNYMVKNKICNSEELKSFNESGYSFNNELSDYNNWVFTRE